MKLKEKSWEEIKNQIQDFFAISKNTENLKDLLSLSEEDLQDNNAVQKFLEQQHLDPKHWNEYIDTLRVKKFLEKKEYFIQLSNTRNDNFTRSCLIKQDIKVLKLLEKEGFLENEINYFLKMLMEKFYRYKGKTIPFDRLQFLIENNIMTPQTIQSLDINFFTIDLSILKQLLEKDVFKKIWSWWKFSPYAEWSEYIHVLAYQVLCWTPIAEIDLKTLLYSEDTYFLENFLSWLNLKQLNLIISFEKKIQPHNFPIFLETMYIIIKKHNYQELIEKLEHKLSLADGYSIITILNINQKKIWEFLNMDDKTFISLCKKIEHLMSSIKEDSLRSILSHLFQYDNYSEILSNLLKITSIMSWRTFSYYYALQNESFNKLWIDYTRENDPYIEALEKLKNSKVPELKYSLVSFLSFILESSDPLNALNALETIYSSSHLPQIVKNFSLFRLLYDDQKLEQIISDWETISPYLKWLPTQERIPIIYKDFLNIAINSNEASLRNLITQLVNWLPLLRKFETWLQKFKQKQLTSNLNLSFSPEEQGQLFQLFEALEVLPFILQPETIDHVSFKRKVFSHDQLEAYYHYLLGKLQVSEWTFLADACDQSLARWGYPQLEGILDSMDEGRKFAMTTNAQKLETNLTVNQWDFLKGVENPEIVLQILQTGILSREYIGAAGADSDTTPFDADFQELVKREDKQALADFLKATYAARVGSYLFLIKDPNQLFWAKKGYEKIIHNDEGHRAIRTGLSTTAISALIMPEELKSEELQAFTYQIAKNGFYLPIYDRNGKLLFTLEDYAQLRKGFAFSPRYEGYTLTTDQTVEKEKNPDLKDLAPQQWYRESSDQAESLSHFTAKKIQTYLKELGIFVSLEQRKSNQEASLLNIGSTGRGTATDLSAQDQDFVLILPPQYADQKEKIIAHLHEKIQTSKKADNEWPRENGAYQLRSEVNKMGKNWSSLPFDLLIMENIHGVQLSSAQAMKERLEHILKTQGQNAYNAVLSNIKAAKSLLAQHNIYKRTDGGLGGIGVEHWILQNEGSLEMALKSFASIAYQGAYHAEKKPLSLQDFQKAYPIYDTGYNWKNGTIDNYILKLTEESYHKLLDICNTWIVNHPDKEH